MSQCWRARAVSGVLLVGALIAGQAATGCAQAGLVGGPQSQQLRPPPTFPRVSTPPTPVTTSATHPATTSAAASVSNAPAFSAAPSSAPAPPSSTPPSSTPPSSTPPSVSSPAGPPAGVRSSAPPGQGGPPAEPGADPFADHEIVAYYGAAGSSSLGVLGRGTPAQAWTKLDAQAAPYDLPGRPALRCFELIATVASSVPGSSGLYRNRVPVSAIEPYLATVRAHGGTLLLDIQPGRSDFLTEAEALEPLLIQPDVGLALDPEWRMTGDQLPGKVIGSVSADEVDAVSSWLDALTASHHLPDKLFVVHEFTESELQDEDDLDNRPHLHEIVNVDGFGSVAVKLSVYHRLARLSPFPMGLKLFYRQDPVLISPAGVAALRPLPQLVDYE